MGYSESAPIVNSLPARSQAQPSGGHGTNWLSLIPSLAAAGASFIPGVGSVASGLIGGAGEAGRELMNGEGLNLGSIATQGFLNAIPGAGLLKGGEQALKLAKPAEKVAAAAAPAVEKAVAPAVETAGSGISGLIDKVLGRTPGAAAPTGNKVGNFLTSAGNNIEARAGGYGVGEKLPGSSSLGYKDAAALNKALADNGIKAGSATTRQQATEAKLGEIGKQIDTHLSQNNTALGDTQRNAIADDFLKSVRTQPGYDPAVEREARQLADNFTNHVNDTKGIIDFRRGVDNQVINFNAGPDSATPAKQLAARTFRDTLNNHTNNLIPGIADLNKNYSSLVDANEFLKGGAKVASDQSTHAGGGIIGRVISSGPAEAAKSVAGQGLQKAGSVVNSPAVGLTANVAAKTGLPIANTIANGSDAGQNPPADQATLNQNALDLLNGGSSQPGQPGAGTPATPDTSQLRSALTMGMLQALQKGDMGAVTAIKTIMDTIAPAQGDGLTIGQKNELVGSNNSIAQLNNYATQLEQAGGGRGVVGGPAELLMGKLGLGGQQAADAVALEQNKADTAAAIASAITGSTRPAASVIHLINESMPSVNDAPDVARAKVANLTARIQAAMKTQAMPVSSIVNKVGQ